VSNIYNDKNILNEYLLIKNIFILDACVIDKVDKSIVYLTYIMINKFYLNIFLNLNNCLEFDLYIYI